MSIRSVLEELAERVERVIVELYVNVWRIWGSSPREDCERLRKLVPSIRGDTAHLATERLVNSVVLPEVGVDKMLIMKHNCTVA
jgi:hypothetical protein